MSSIKEYYQEQKPGYILICAAKSGWLLLSHDTHPSLNSAFFLYSPFADRTIKLPNLQTSPHWRNATFTTDPTSADCVFFVLQTSSLLNTVSASTCRHGDTKWTTHIFPGSFDAIDSVVYSEGLFWCATDHGRLATFSVSQGIWNVLQSPAPLLLSNYASEETYFVESNRNLLLILMSHKYKARQVFKLDRSQMTWIWVEDIGDQNLFLGRTALSVSTRVSGKSRGSGKIHYPWRSKCRFLSRNCKRSYSYLKHYGLLAIEEKELSEIWIEPPS